LGAKQKLKFKKKQQRKLTILRHNAKSVLENAGTLVIQCSDGWHRYSVFPSKLWHCSLGDRKDVWPIRKHLPLIPLRFSCRTNAESNYREPDELDSPAKWTL